MKRLEGDAVTGFCTQKCHLELRKPQSDRLLEAGNLSWGGQATCLHFSCGGGTDPPTTSAVTAVADAEQGYMAFLFLSQNKSLAAGSREKNPGKYWHLACENCLKSKLKYRAVRMFVQVPVGRKMPRLCSLVVCERCTGTRSSQQLSPAMKCMGKEHFTGITSTLQGSGSLTYVNLSATPSNHLWLADFFQVPLSKKVSSACSPAHQSLVQVPGFVCFHRRQLWGVKNSFLIWWNQFRPQHLSKP